MRPAEAVAQVLRKYGQQVRIHREGQAAEAACRALIQPILERTGEQRQATVLGTVCADRWLYLGAPEEALDDLGEGWILWKGRKMEVLRCKPIEVGGQRTHWWAILRRKELEP